MGLILKNITKKYKKYIALDNINYNFTNGVYGLVGPNGAGKSTLMKIITGVLSPDLGEVIFNDIPITKLSEKYRENLGYLPQNIEFYPSYSVYEMMKYICHLKGISPGNVEPVINNCLEKVALQEHRNKKTSKLSGGMKRRLGIAQAIIGNPKIVILDEPTAGLDPNERMRFRNLIAGLGCEHVVILSTHIVSDIEAAAKEIIFLRSGKIAKSGIIADILSELKGSVWELTCNEKIYSGMLLEHIPISAMQVSGEKVNIRYVGDRYNESSLSVEPRLEDIYLDVFGEVSAE